MSVKKSRAVFIAFMFLILVVLSALMWMRFDTSVKSFSELQATLMTKQAEQAANGINETINSIRHRMSAISIDRLWLNDLAEFANDVEIQEELAKRFKLYFPKMQTYIIADAHGRQIGGDYDFFIADVCQQDINNVAKMLQPNVDYFEYKPYIHPKPDNYHFDIMMPVFAKQRKLVFFMSFDAKLLRDNLASKVISDHNMFMVKTDNPSLIEVSTEFVRDQLKRPFHLSKAELSRIKATQDVPDTQWRIVVVENPDVLGEFKRLRLRDMTFSFAIVLLFWVTVLWLGLQHENARGKLLRKLSQMSHHDELTSLANRRKLIKELEQVKEDAKYLSTLSSVIFIDLNDFKKINDTYGHKAGDVVLKECAKRLVKLTRNSDLVARLGGDEFVVLLKDLGEDSVIAEKVITEMVARLRKTLSEPYKYNDIVMTCLPSIGTRLITAEDSEIANIIHDADEKMYADKSKVKSV